MATKAKKPVDPATDPNSPYGCLTCHHSRLGRNVPVVAIKCDLDHNTKYGRLCKKYDAAKGRMT